MKFIIRWFVAVCLVAVVSAGQVPLEFREVAPQIRQACLAETGVDVGLVEKANNGIFTPDDKLKCYLKCTYAHFELIPNGEIDFVKFENLAPPSYKGVFPKYQQKGCQNIKPKNGDTCGYIYEISKCFQSASPQEFFVI